MGEKITMRDLRTAKGFGRLMLRKDTLFYLKRREDDDLFKPTVVLKMGTVVEVEKLYRRGRCALLKYADRSGKVWWSWTHATEFEPPRKYANKTEA